MLVPVDRLQADHFDFQPKAFRRKLGLLSTAQIVSSLSSHSEGIEDKLFFGAGTVLWKLILPTSRTSNLLTVAILS